MEDSTIIDLYWQRSEQAIAETDKKYGKLCHRIAYNILSNQEDAEETVNDTYMTAWKRIPPTRPVVFAGYLGKITRYISINRWNEQTAKKRGGGQIPAALDELQDCADDREDVEHICESKDVIRSYNAFLGTLPQQERNCFLRRYFYMDSIDDIACATGFSRSKVTSMLYRTRKKLKQHLETEGYL